MTEKPNYKEGSVKAKLLRIFERSGWITYADIRDYFDRNGKGINSIDRFKRYLKADGFIIKMRHRDHNCYEYKLTGWSPDRKEEPPKKPDVKEKPKDNKGDLFPVERYSYTD